MNLCIIHIRIAAIALSLLGVLAFNSCTKDDFDKYLTYESIPPALLVPQPGYPIPGNNGLITISSVSETSIRLLWAKASDETTPQSDLEYRLFMSESYNINTVAEAEANGTPVTGWMIDTTGAAASGLTPGRTYFFNVLVADRDGNTSAYTTVSSTTLSNAVYMFSAGPHQGNLTTMTSSMSPRNVIDDYCINAKSSYPSLPCQNVMTFISIDSSDDIADMPTNYGVPSNKKIVGPTGIPIAVDWAGLLDGSIDVELQKAGISDTYWWSGSDVAGNYLTAASCVACNTCSGWTDGTNASQGMSGAHNRTDSTWINDGTRSCTNSLNILCICW
jgi:hypothetical protein